ncbi:MAG TPA: YifB family Mg chelatase-like AAA ATPase [Acidimicrobiales bacterium]|nr:YifB family Mg chelatase-like AAA ATPase [Acidimicrobiales bacterium]
MIATVVSATLVGVEGRSVAVEVHAANGLPGFRVVGLPDASCREARDRVRAAIISSGYRWPQKRVTVNLAPSGVRKAGSGLDLAIALGTLAADGQVPAACLDGHAFIAELGLDGSLRPIPGMLPLAAAVRAGAVVVAPSNAQEAALVRREAVRVAPDLATLARVLGGELPWPDLPPPGAPPAPPPPPDLGEVKGQVFGRRALEVAAAGGHHLLLVGPAGSGKTMLALRLPGLLPPLSPAEALEVAQVHSAAGLQVGVSGLCLVPPFRSPHHSASAVALIGGGGARLRPGEVSCAHLGVLFLDELAEFPGAVLDNLRQPLEEGRIVVCRASAAASFPARFMLVAAMNACRCAGDGSPGSCHCPAAQRERYVSRISGPLLDRFDIRVRVRRPDVAELLGASVAPPRCAGDAGRRGYAGGSPGGAPCQSEPTSVVAARVAAARQRARDRGARCNSEIPAAMLDVYAPLSAGARRLLARRVQEGRLSARGLVRTRRVALTLADLSGEGGSLSEEHVLTALALRSPGILGHDEETAERGHIGARSEREAVPGRAAAPARAQAPVLEQA